MPQGRAWRPHVFRSIGWRSARLTGWVTQAGVGASARALLSRGANLVVFSSIYAPASAWMRRLIASKSTADNYQETGLRASGEKLEKYVSNAWVHNWRGSQEKEGLSRGKDLDALASSR